MIQPSMTRNLKTSPQSWDNLYYDFPDSERQLIDRLRLRQYLLRGNYQPFSLLTAESVDRP